MSSEKQQDQQHAALDGKLSIEDAIAQLQRIQQLQRSRRWYLVVRKTNPGGLTAHQTTPITALHAGSDWEAGQVVLEPASPLTELSAADVDAIRQSVSKGQSWHAYQADQQRLRKLCEALGVKVDTFAAALREIEKLRAAAAGAVPGPASACRSSSHAEEAGGAR